MLISILISSRNRRRDLELTLSSLDACENPYGEEAELVIVNNGSTDSTADYLDNLKLASFRTKIVHTGPIGRSKALNAVIGSLCSRVALFTDDDLRFPKTWLVRMCEPILTGQSDAVVGRVHMAQELRRSWMSELHRNWLVDHSGIQDFDHSPMLVGANMAIATDVLLRSGGLDELLGPGSLGFCDDSLLGVMLREAGCRIQWELKGEPVIHHFKPDRLLRGSWLNRAKQQGISSGYMLRHWDQPAFRLSALRMAVYTSLLLYRRAWRLLCGNQPKVSEEGCDEWELRLLEKIYKNRRFLTELSVPPKYPSPRRRIGFTANNFRCDHVQSSSLGCPL